MLNLGQTIAEHLEEAGHRLTSHSELTGTTDTICVFHVRRDSLNWVRIVINETRAIVVLHPYRAGVHCGCRRIDLADPDGLQELDYQLLCCVKPFTTISG